MNKAKCFLIFIFIECIVLFALLLHGAVAQKISQTAELQAKTVLVSRLGLTDFALWTEARYTRHPSQTDFFSPFQDFPGAPDHFPAGSILAPSNVSPGEK